MFQYVHSLVFNNTDRQSRSVCSRLIFSTRTIRKSIINATAFLCIMIALKKQRSQNLPILAASPMTAALLAFIFLGESLSLTEVMGMMLIVVEHTFSNSKKAKNISAPFRVFIDPASQDNF
ncbi:MAG: EamA family transporter [Ignavibacteria bacterium]